VAERAHQRDGRRAGRRGARDRQRDGIEAKGGAWSPDEEDAFKQPILDQFATQAHPYYASARLWDDGVIDPAHTRACSRSRSRRA